MTPELRPFQKAGARFLCERKAALLADEQGLGKTPQAIVACNMVKAKKILVICPAVVKLNWKREFEVWSKGAFKIQVVQGRSDVITDADVVILNYDLLSSMEIFKQLIARHFAVGIFDEAHYMKNREAKRTKAVLLKGAIASHCVYKWFLTGTPVLNRPIELYPILKAAAPEVIEPYDSYDAFAKRYCDGYWDGFQLVAKGASNVEELSLALNSGFMLRRLKKDVLKELPDKQYQMISIAAKDAKTKALVKKEFTFSRGDARYGGVDAGGAEIALLRHELALSKVDMCVDHIEDVLVETEKIVVFAYHKDVIEQLAEKLKDYGVAVITGATVMGKRQEAVDDFQNKPAVRVFIGNIQAAGIGITLTAASHVIFVESSWVPGEVDQATDRCHRFGQKNSVLVQFLVIEQSLEEHMIRTIIDKRMTIHRIVNEDPEVSRMLT